jgi:DNA-binding protein H-NS
MAAKTRKSILERRAEKLSQIEKLKQQLAELQDAAADRIGRIAIKAGLADLAIDDDALLKELETIANKFRPPEQKPPGKK